MNKDKAAALLKYCIEAIEYRSFPVLSDKLDGFNATLRELILYGNNASLGGPASIAREQIWNPHGYGVVIERSGFTTGVLAKDIADQLGADLSRPYTDFARDLFKSLQFRNGHLHDNTIQPGRLKPKVLNITAFSLEHSSDSLAWKYVEYIIRSQRKDGIFSYISPSGLQQVIHKWMPEIEGRIYSRLYGDCSIFFFDVSHHCYILYLLNRYRKKNASTLSQQQESMIFMALRAGLNALDVNDLFAEEPEPKQHRFCNFSDTTSYFLLLSVAASFREQEVVGWAEETLLQKIEGIFVEDKLFEPLVHHESNRYKLPAIWMAPYWKIYLLKEYLTSAENR